MDYLKTLLKKRWLIIISLLLLLLGVLWQDGMMRREEKIFPPQGSLYRVNNHNMHLYGMGEGDVTVVFIPGSGTPCAFTDFYALQNDVQQFARTVSFDRAGYSWSEPTDMPRSIDVLTEELHQLLEAANESPPYILAAHSLASLEAIHFAQKYTDEVKGIVLLDGGNPYFYAEDSEVSAIVLNRFQALLRATGIIRVLGELGVLLPFSAENLRYDGLPDDIKSLDKSMYYNKSGESGNIAFIKEMNENAKVVIDGGALTDIPLYILTSDNGEHWTESQKQLTKWSNMGVQETIPEAHHYLHWTHKEIVVEKISLIISGN